MAFLLSRVIVLLVAFALLPGGALTKDHVRPTAIEGQTAEQTRKDQEERNRRRVSLPRDGKGECPMNAR